MKTQTRLARWAGLIVVVAAVASLVVFTILSLNTSAGAGISTQAIELPSAADDAAAVAATGEPVDAAVPVVDLDGLVDEPVATATTVTPAPTAVPEPTQLPVLVPPTATPVPPTATEEPATATPAPPTAVPVTSTAVPVAPTATPQPAAPTATPVPTATPLPTATPVPQPTATPEPTATVEATATPAPTGDSVTLLAAESATDSSTAEPTATAVSLDPAATPEATPLPAATATPTATPVAQDVTGTVGGFTAGNYWINSSGGGLNLRAVPAVTSGGVIAVLDDRTAVTATGVSSVDATGRLWVQISAPLSGWSAAEFITSSLEAVPTPEPTATADVTAQPATTETATVEATATPVAVTGSTGLPLPEQWNQVRICESGNNYSINTGNGYYGAYQFSIQTWNSVARLYRPQMENVLPSDASVEDQDAMANLLYVDSGPHQWPQCGRFLPGF